MDVIRDRYLVATVEIAGPHSIPPAELARLQKKGLLPKKIPNFIRRAYEFGVLAGEMEAPQITSLTYQEFQAKLASGAVPPLSYEEKAAVKHLGRVNAERLKGLGNKFSQRLNQVVIEADQKLRRRLLGRVKREMVQGVEHRRSVKEIASKLSEVTGDAARDWERIASTEVHNAFLEGRADHIAIQNKGKDPLVFKRPRPDCCPNCAEHYLEAGSKVPKIFHLSELVANGSTNEGRKVSEWLPTIGCLHPWCQCILHELPPGFGFDSTGNMVYQGR